MTGPVQVLVVGFEQPTYSGAVLAELGRLEEAGIVRLVDVLLVSRAEDGSLETLDLPDVPGADGTGRIAATLLGSPEEASSDGPAADDGRTWSLADAVPIGQVAAVALIEHRWAIPLRTAMRDNGAQPLDETWLGADDLGLLDQLLADSPDVTG